MDVGSAVALIAGKAANLDVLLDDEDQSLQGIVNRAVAHLAGHQGLNIGGVLVSNDLGQVLGEVNKLVVLGDEVGLGVDLNDNSAVVERNGIDHALGGDAASLLVGSSRPCSRRISIAFSKSPSAWVSAFLHSIMPQSVSLTQLHNVFCRNSHSAQCPF